MVRAAAAGSSRVAFSNAGLTGIDAAVPSNASFAQRSGSSAAAASAASDPMLWPTSAARRAPAASARAHTHSAIASTLASGGPSDAPWPGQSTARTARPRQANQRVCDAHTVRSMPAP